MIRLLRKTSLRFKALQMIVVGLASAIVLAFLFNTLCMFVFSKTYLSKEKCQERNSKVFYELQEYVFNYDISSSDYNSLYEWSSDRGNVVLSIYPPDSDKSQCQHNGGEYFSIVSGSIAHKNTVSYEIDFYDGRYNILLTDYSEDDFYRLIDYFTYAVFALTVLVFCFIYITGITKRISQLSKQVAKIEKVSVHSPLVISGNDEITRLATDINSMRYSLIEGFQSEQKAWESNTELLTSISHDIRNPLTSLIGYCDILENEQYNDEEERKKFVKSCRKKAYQLKSQLDDLFEYFLVFGRREIDLDVNKYNAGILLEQLLAERNSELLYFGITSEITPMEEDVEISVDISLLARVFDNIYSNIKKYARHDSKVYIVEKCSNGLLYLKFVNLISEKKKEVISTKIGLKSCRRIAELLHFSFATDSQNGVFSVEMAFPYTNQKDEQ